MGHTTSYDSTRSGRMFAVGLSQGPPHHYWYMYLDKILPKADLRTIVLKIIMDQIFAAPFFCHYILFRNGNSGR